ncbi:MAG: acyl-CoA dehydrogenase [Calditrichaeota bacterium]|nr:MAG: acyl-CoA dehydrogenase [Calditrichota bacterium]
MLSGDLDPHGEAARHILREAGRAGYLSDLLPFPLGTANPRVMLKSLIWQHSIKLEELCAVCGGAGLLIGANALGAMPILLSGKLSQVARFLLPAFARSKRGRPSVFAFAITEPAGGSDVEDSHGASHYRPGTVARRVSGGWQLNGRKVFISGGDIADAVTVFAALENEGLDAWTCFLVKKGMAGFRCGRNELKMGQRLSSATELIFENVFVPDDHVIGKLRQGWALNRMTLNFSRIPVGAIALGIARGAMEQAIHFACRTHLAGKPLINYQDVQLSIAEMITLTTAMRSLVWQNAQTWRPGQANASIAKVFCSDRAVEVCTLAMELLGNHGFLHSQSVEKSFRDARLTQIYEGTNQINRLSIIEDQLQVFGIMMHTEET